MNSFLPHVDPTVDAVLERVSERGEKRQVVQLAGPSSAGKSVALRELNGRLEETEGRLPVLVAPPARALDSGPVGLVQIGSKLAHGGFADGESELGDLLDPHRQWKDKVSIVREWMTNASDQVVILCDEPTLWPATGHTHFSRGAEDLIDRLVFDGTGCDVVVAGRPPQGTEVTHLETLAPASAPAELLSDDKWGPLGKAAERLLEEVGEEQLERHSPLQLRLLVALLAVDPEKDPRAWLAGAEVEETACALIERLRIEADTWEEILHAWKRLARVRVPFDDELLAAIGADQLADRERAMLEHCLLYEQAGERMLHETLRRAGQGAGPLPEGEEALQGTLADYYRSRFDRLADTERSLADSMEAFHHASKSSEFDFSQHQPYFVEQLNALGFHLSMEERRYPDAVVAYERALEWDDKDDYAHHYLAFNLDIQPRDRERVERHYLKAVELSPSHPWWHASLVNFFAATGRFDRAREAWSVARSEFETPDANLTINQCQDLHIRVARTALEFGQIEFCETVLRGVPEDLREEVGGYETVRKMVDARRMARDHGNFVPGPLLKKHWWREGPFLFEPEGVKQWMAGEVKESSDAGLLIDAAIIDRSGELEEPPPSGPLEVSAAELRSWGNMGPEQIGIGDFVELVIGEDGETKLDVHQQREWEDTSLTRLRPDPRRYL